MNNITLSKDPETGFDGAKIAILVGDRVLTLLRDDKPGLVFPGMWDLPGGARDPGESPEDTALRELREELGLRLDPARICYRRAYREDLTTWFFGAMWPDLDLTRVRFGDEGQGWAAMPVAEFLSRTDAIGHLQARLAAFLVSNSGG